MNWEATLIDLQRLSTGQWAYVILYSTDKGNAFKAEYTADYLDDGVLRYTVQQEFSNLNRKYSEPTIKVGDKISLSS